MTSTDWPLCQCGHTAVDHALRECVRCDCITYDPPVPPSETPDEPLPPAVRKLLEQIVSAHHNGIPSTDENDSGIFMDGSWLLEAEDLLARRSSASPDRGTTPEPVCGCSCGHTTPSLGGCTREDCDCACEPATMGAGGGVSPLPTKRDYYKALGAELDATRADQRSRFSLLLAEIEQIRERNAAAFRVNPSISGYGERIATLDAVLALIRREVANG